MGVLPERIITRGLHLLPVHHGSRFHFIQQIQPAREPESLKGSQTSQLAFLVHAAALLIKQGEVK